MMHKSQFLKKRLVLCSRVTHDTLKASKLYFMLSLIELNRSVETPVTVTDTDRAQHTPNPHLIQLSAREGH